MCHLFNHRSQLSGTPRAAVQPVRANHRAINHPPTSPRHDSQRIHPCLLIRQLHRKRRIQPSSTRTPVSNSAHNNPLHLPLHSPSNRCWSALQSGESLGISCGPLRLSSVISNIRLSFSTLDYRPVPAPSEAEDRLQSWSNHR